MRCIRFFVLAGLTLCAGCDNSRSPTASRQALSQAQCLEFAEFDDPAASPYCLPFTTDEAYPLSQSYCSASGWSHHTRFAYDFDMPIGTEILAARAGEVVELREHYSDDDPSGGHENTVILRHSDGTLGLYLHLMHQGVLVEMGDPVAQGALLGWSGRSGSSLAHLHFQVCLRSGKCSYQTEEITLPVNFRNAQGSHNAANGLVQGETYLALPCS